MAQHRAPALPPETDAHRRAAFERLAMRGWTYTAALANPLRARVIEAMAHKLRTAEWQATHQRTTTTVARIHPQTGQWHTQRVPGNWDDQQGALPVA